MEKVEEIRKTGLVFSSLLRAFSILYTSLPFFFLLEEVESIYLPYLGKVRSGTNELTE